MAGDESDWTPFDAVVAHVEATQHCYRRRAITLVREAIDGSKVKSRSEGGFPSWMESCFEDGTEIFFSSYGKGIEAWREDVLREWPERTQQLLSSAQTASSNMPKRRRPREAGIVQAIHDSWPNGIPETLTAKDRENKIRAWHEKKGISIPKGSLSRQIQRALKVYRNLYGPERISKLLSDVDE